MKSYREMTKEEVKAALRQICNGSKSEDQVRTRLRDELGYTGSAAITSTSTSSSGMTMIMFMVMINGPRGDIISV